MKLTPPYHSERKTLAYVTDDEGDAIFSVAIGQQFRSIAGNVYQVESLDHAQNRIMVRRVYPVRDWETSPYAFMPWQMSKLTAIA